MFLPVLIFAAFGLIVGSFLNVVILRFGEKGARRRRGFGGHVGGRSACMRCNTQLRWPDLIPVFSYLALRGRCRYCRAHISVQYPLVEAGTAAAFVLIGLSDLPLAAMLCALAIASLLICIFVFDLYHKLIPDLWVWSFCALALLYAFLTVQFSVFNFLAGPLAAVPIFFLWALSFPFTGTLGQWMGFGDVKLALGIGWLLSVPTTLILPLGVVAIFFAFIIGAAISVGILLPLPTILSACGIRTKEGQGGYTMRSEVPFGPFLILSCVVVWLLIMYNIEIPLLI